MAPLSTENRRRQAFVVGWPLTRLGGVSEVVRNLVREFAGAGDLAPVVIEVCEGRCGESMMNVPVLRLPLPAPYDEHRPWRAIAAFCLKMPALLWRWRNVCREYRIEVLNPHFIGPQYLGLTLARRLGLFRGTLMLSLHGTDVHRMLQSRGLERFLSTTLLRGADWLIPCSQGLGEQLREFAPECASRIIPVLNGVDADYFVSSVESAVEWPAHFAGRIRLLSVGAFQYAKGHDVLLRAFAQIRRARPEICLIIAGGNGAELCKTELLVQKLGLQNDLLLLHNVPHGRVAALLQQADLFILPSRREGFAMVLLEAGAAGKPVIACEACGVKELITHGVSGWTVPVERPDLLAAAIKEALSEPEESARRGRNLQALVRSRFTWNRAHAQYLEIAHRARASVRLEHVEVIPSRQAEAQDVRHLLH